MEADRGDGIILERAMVVNLANYEGLSGSRGG